MRTDSKIVDVKELVDSLQKEKSKLTGAEVLKEQYIPWATTSNAIAKYIQRDKANENILKAEIVGEGTQKRYYLTPKNIIRYVKKYAPVLLDNKQYVGNKNIDSKGKGNK